MRKLKKVIITGCMVTTIMGTTACTKPYDKPAFVTIEASQTAFLVPLIGDTTDQASFKSEELLEKAQIATKEVQIPHRWVQTGRMHWIGEYRDAAKLIVVERSPITREWNASKEKGTSKKNQSVMAESKESIGFSVGMNCSAQIDTEKDAVKFLYSYNNKSLADIMDTEIRARVESKFVEECAYRSLNSILKEKEIIMKAVRNDVMDYFKNRGITITVLGLKDGVTYNDDKIQTSINEKFSSEQKLVTQENENKRLISEAEAKAKSEKIAAEAQAESNVKLAKSLTKELVEKIKYEKWDGKLPQVQGVSSAIVDVTK